MRGHGNISVTFSTIFKQDIPAVQICFQGIGGTVSGEVLHCRLNDLEALSRAPREQPM